MSFPTAIESQYRVVRTQHGIGEEDAEYTIPLGSHRKGGGLAGKKGHVYIHGLGSAGIWLNGRSARRQADSLRSQFPELKIMQVGDGEMTFRVPMGDLDRLLPILGAKRRPVMTNARLAALEKATAKSAPYQFKRGDGGQRPIPDTG